MSNSTTNNREAKAAVKSLLSEVDRIIIAAKRAEKAIAKLERPEGGTKK